MPVTPRRSPYGGVVPALAVALVVLAVFSVRLGAVPIGFGAALYFVLGAALRFHAGEWTLPVAACLGGALATSCVFLLAETAGSHRESTTTVLLIGIAVNA